MSLMVSAGFASTAELLQITTDFETVPSFALEAMRKKIEDFAFMVAEREQQALFDTIDTAIADGVSIKELAELLSDTFAEGYHVTNSDGDVVKRVPTDAWSKMVARTELSRAQTMGAVALYQAAEIRTVQWATNHGQTVCDECDDADGEVVELGDTFDGVDVDQPPAHPNCCCTLLPADKDVAYPGTGSQELEDAA